MPFPIRPGKVTCAGIVAIMMVTPNSIWKGADAEVARPVKYKVEKAKKLSHSVQPRVKLRKVPR